MAAHFLTIQAIKATLQRQPTRQILHRPHAASQYSHVKNRGYCQSLPE
jgi:hypothetical protein